MTSTPSPHQAPSRKRLVDLNEADSYASCCRETIRRRIANGSCTCDDIRDISDRHDARFGSATVPPDPTRTHITNGVSEDGHA